MENVIAIGAGLALRVLIDTLTDSDHRLTSTLIGLWEGIVLSHFLKKDPRNSSDAYLALATRFAIDLVLTSSAVRFALTGIWTVVGLLLSDIAPSVWRGTGLRHMYKALKKDFKAMRRAVPQWRIENDIKVPNISISSPLFSRPPPSTIVSSTLAAPPTSPVPVLGRRPSSGAPASQATSSDINPLTREVLLGPSPVLISTAVNPLSFDPYPHSHRTSLLSDTHEPDPSRLNPILIVDDDRAHITPLSGPDEQEQSQDPELSALDISPPVPEVEVISANVEIISPTPVTRIRTLPVISDIDISVAAHQVPLPQSRPASRVTTTGATGKWRGNVRALADRTGSDLGPDFGRAYHQRSSSAGVQGSGQHPSNCSGSTGLQRPDSSLRRREGSTISEKSWRRGVVEPTGDNRVTELSPSGPPGTETFVGGFVMQAGRQTFQRSGTPQVQPGTGNIRASSVLGLTTSHPSSRKSTPPPKLKPTTSAPSITSPAPAYQAQPTASTSHSKSDDAAPSKTLTPVPPSKTATPKPNAVPSSKTPIPVPPSKTATPKPNAMLPSKSPISVPPSKANTPKSISDCATSDPTSGTNRATDYNPAEPIRPLIGSPSTVHDPIFGATHRAYVPVDLDTTEYEIGDSPPPEYESPMDVHGEGFGEANGESSGVGAVTEGGVNNGQGATEGDRQKVVADENIGDVCLGVQKAGEGEQGASQGTGEYTQDVGENTTKLEENAQVNLGDNQEQGMSKLDEVRGGEGADGNHQANNDVQTSEVVQVADESAGRDTQVVASAEDPKKSTPTTLTPEQTEAEATRAAFLRETISQLEKSRLESQEADLHKIQARVDLLKERIARTSFTDPPDDPPLAFELPACGALTLTKLKEVLVNLLIERQDAGPIRARVSYSSGIERKNTEKVIKSFIATTGFSMSSDSTSQPYATIITM